MAELIREVDLGRDGGALLTLLQAYAEDPMGGGAALPQAVLDNLVPRLELRSDYRGVIASIDDQPAGLINAFEGFSTFAARPLLNIHDVIVAPPFRGRGLSQRMMEVVEQLARERGCCKLTLEVLGNNTVAQGAYRKFGFGPYRLDPAAGQALFWQKAL
ncbi:MAG: GNAT family N-acetyltransferase [Gammaproteobacteria bacterium]|nr:GNAT family N-acetyltransferase [Gammaproteobacteria bacterium]